MRSDFFFRVLLLPLAATLTSPAQAPETVAKTTAVEVTVNTLANRHPISSYICGGNFPPNAAHVTQSGATLVRWGGQCFDPDGGE